MGMLVQLFIVTANKCRKIYTVQYFTLYRVSYRYKPKFKKLPFLSEL